MYALANKMHPMRHFYPALTGIFAIIWSATTTKARESGFVDSRFKWRPDWTTKALENTSTPTPTICWENSSPTYTAPNGRVYDHTAIKNTTVEIIRITWERYSNIKFIWQDGFGISCDVKVHLDHEGVSLLDDVGYAGKNLYLNISWMVPLQGAFDANSKHPPSLKWNSTATSPATRQNLQYDYLRETVIHEFGHILGLVHEQNRHDRPKDSQPQGPPGDVPIGAYDIFSIMNYDWTKQNQNPIPKLSCGDVATARYLYGPHPTFPNLAPSCTPEAIKTATPSQLAPDQFTSWVADINLNSGTRTGKFADDYPRDNGDIVTAIPGVYQDNGRYLNTRILITRTNGTIPGYDIRFSLVDPNPNPNDPSLSCSKPMKIPQIRLATIEKPSGYSKWLPESCNENSFCHDIPLPSVQLSACNPAQTVSIPAGKGTYNAATKSFKFAQCDWQDQTLIGYVGSAISFGMFSSGGTSTCVERDGLFTEFLFYINGDWFSKAPPVSLPADYGRAIKFYPAMPEASSLPSSIVALSDGTRKYDYLISKHEVTQGEYHGVMKKLPFGHLGNLSVPAENISWFDAILYCNKKSELGSLNPVYTYQTASFDAQGNCTGLSNLSVDHSKNGYRLPTVDEWKQAYRAGTTTFWYWPGSYPTSPQSPNYAWYWDNSGGEPHSIGLKIPNNWDLYDMGGNVSEWVWAGPGETYAYQMGGHTRDLEFNVDASGTMRVKSERHPYNGFRVLRRVGSVQPTLQFLLMD